MAYRAFLDRNTTNINCLFTIQDEKGVKFINRMPCTSGQQSTFKAASKFSSGSEKWHYYQNWSRWNGGKGLASPIPFSVRAGKFRLWTKAINKGLKAGATGIGEFYPISTGDNPRLIQDPANPSQFRYDIGLHPENMLPGTLGCIGAKVEDSPLWANQWLRLSKFMAELHKQGIQYIDLIVL
jgi:hypothetical protein